jgi:hypothetical protein
MKRIARATVLATVATTALLGTTGVALANDQGQDNGQNQSQGWNGDSGLDRGLNGGGASANGAAVGSPGVLSGNVVQIPIHIPVNVCGNSVDVIGLLNPAAGNVCVNR